MVLVSIEYCGDLSRIAGSTTLPCCHRKEISSHYRGPAVHCGPATLATGLGKKPVAGDILKPVRCFVVRRVDGGMRFRMATGGAKHHKHHNSDPIQQTRQRFTAKGYAAGQGTDSSRTKTPDDHG